MKRISVVSFLIVTLLLVSVACQEGETKRADVKQDRESVFSY